MGSGLITSGYLRRFFAHLVALTGQPLVHPAGEAGLLVAQLRLVLLVQIPLLPRQRTGC